MRVQDVHLALVSAALPVRDDQRFRASANAPLGNRCRPLTFRSSVGRNTLVDTLYRSSAFQYVSHSFGYRSDAPGCAPRDGPMLPSAGQWSVLPWVVVLGHVP